MKSINYKGKLCLFVLLSIVCIMLFPATVFAENENLTLIEGLSPWSAARLTLFGDNMKLLVFTGDNRDIGNVYDSAYVVWSLAGEESQFSVPRAVEGNEEGYREMEPFLYADGDALILWSRATEHFGDTWTGADMAGVMRISLCMLEKDTLQLKGRISNASLYNGNNIATCTPKAFKIGDKVLVSWVVCHNVADDTKAYGIEGMYYDAASNSFYGENNSSVPIVLAKDCNYIPDYFIAEKNGQAVVLLEEAPSEDIHISDVIYQEVTASGVYKFRSERYWNRILKLVTDNGNTVTDLTDGASYASVVEMDGAGLFYYHQNGLYTIDDSLTAVKVGDVSETGDSEYDIVCQNGTALYVVAKKYTPLKTTDSQIVLNNVTYTRGDDGKWSDEAGNIREIEQEGTLYYIFDNNTLYPLRGQINSLTGGDKQVIQGMPDCILRNDGSLDCIYISGGLGDTSNRKLAYCKYDYQLLLQSDYSRVDEAIEKVKGLTVENYRDFSGVTAAVDAIVRGKDYKEQTVVDGYAKAIEDAIAALEFKDADYSRVDEAITKANGLNADNYRDFSGVRAAVDAVIRGKNCTEQAVVDGYAKAIGDAIAALELKPTPVPAETPVPTETPIPTATPAPTKTPIPTATPASTEAPSGEETAQDTEQVSHKMLEGANQVISPGEEAVFRSDAELKDFQRIVVDGREISSDNYTLREGSTIVTLKKEYVETLSAGKHSISIVSTTGSADTEFTVMEAGAGKTADGSNPKTGDDSNMLLWGTLAVAALAGIVAVYYTKIRKKQSEQRDDEKGN